MLRQIRLLVFDLDYLIFDCSLRQLQALRQSLISFSDGMPQHVHLPDAIEIESAFRDHGRLWIRSLDLEMGEESLADLEREYQVHERRLIEAGIGREYAGISEVLLACRREGMVLTLGAEASRDYLMAVSDRHDLDRSFEILLCTEEYGRGGAGEMLSDALNQAEVNPSETLVFGTRRPFFDASRALDLFTIGCDWGLQQKDALETADFQSPTVDHILQVIRRIDEIGAQYAG